MVSYWYGDAHNFCNALETKGAFDEEYLPLREDAFDVKMVIIY
jgi:hypothetical protein